MHALVAAVIAVFMSNPAIVPPSDVPLLLEQMEGQLADRDEEVRKLPCGHYFHKGCIDEWLTRSCECPICKHNIDRDIREY